MTAFKSTNAKMRYVLHFDLNRTVLMSDAVGGRSMENTVNYLLSECSWGYLNTELNKWKCVSKFPSVQAPEQSESISNQLITYKQHVDNLHPYQSISIIDDPMIIKALNKDAKKKRTALQSAFTEEFGPGSSLRESFSSLMQCLSIPNEESKTFAKEMGSTLNHCRLKESWLAGRVYLLPSFINFLFYLAELIEQGDSEYRIVYRTFGDDILEVAKEISFLIEGNHPLFPGKKLPKCLAPLSTFGTFYRDGYGSEGTLLALGTLEKVPQSISPEKFYANNKNVRLIKGFVKIHEEIANLLEQNFVIGLRDYWEWWSVHAEHEEYGKLLLIDQDNFIERSIFFDDHIERTSAHIVDVRDINSGNPINFSYSNGKYLFRAEPYEAIVNPDYYIDFLNRILTEKPSITKY